MTKNQHVIEWDLSKKIDHNKSLNDITGTVFRESIDSLYHTFEFTIEGVLKHDKCTSFDNFINQTDWLNFSQDRTFNLVYAFNTRNLDLIIVDQYQTVGIKLKNKHLYCMPYWMTYKFCSSEKEYNQEIISVGIITPQRPKSKKTKKLW